MWPYRAIGQILDSKEFLKVSENTPIYLQDEANFWSDMQKKCWR